MEASFPAAVTGFRRFSQKKTKMKRRRAQAHCACPAYKKNDANSRSIASSRAVYRRLQILIVDIAMCRGIGYDF